MARSRSSDPGARCARASVVAWGLSAIAGCGEASVDVVAVWVDGVSDADGNRPLRIYHGDGHGDGLGDGPGNGSGNERSSLLIIPDIPGSGIDVMQVGVDPLGRGIAVSGTNATVWMDRGSGRRVTVSPEAAGLDAVVEPGFSFTRAGDALLRALEVEPGQPPAWLLAPLGGPSQRVHVLEAPRAAASNHHWSLRHAADAPVVMLAEIGGAPPGIDGELWALAYPSDEGEGPVVEHLRPLARGAMQAVGQAEDPTFLRGCEQQLCLSPSGRVAFASAWPTGCELWRWSWVDAESTGVDTPPEPIDVPCPTDAQVRLTAVLDDDLVVMDDWARIHLVDLGAGTATSLPKPSGVLSVHPVARGHGLVISSLDGSVARVDAHGLRMVNGVQTPCGLRDGLAVSPSGAWVVQTCNGQNGAPSGVDGQVQRISVLGTEVYGGVPMRPIAIDDEGNALLYSISSDDDDGVPRGLFVLTGDGQLMRVDELEPFPARVLVEGAEGVAIPARFAVSGPR
ncbi:hypothetical protein [Paraliomyxa miuraensis]|uniref:hypothetical protein n=1 Tax=Paraliomyxa miuraensis TaxID=376150 RepID=UPI00225BFB0F|nr:hypothetical protein [Paraliomyxa miuraensis]MCX4245891.1 hypothetical protein [Paraliomyxa miuraensis]